MNFFEVSFSFDLIIYPVKYEMSILAAEVKPFGFAAKNMRNTFSTTLCRPLSQLFYRQLPRIRCVLFYFCFPLQSVEVSSTLDCWLCRRLSVKAGQ